MQANRPDDREYHASTLTVDDIAKSEVSSTIYALYIIPNSQAPPLITILP